jgi:exodeoxyribonuclease V beta subunit
LIEASAGTGKTFTITLLYLRLVLEAGYSVRQIVVTTFTDAAAQELRQRIRERLIQVGPLLDSAATPPPEYGNYLQRLQEQFDCAELRRRLKRALADLDLAPISTIHGLCRRILTDFPFDSGSAFQLGELVDEGQLARECVEDFWRARFLAPDSSPGNEEELLRKADQTIAALSVLAQRMLAHPDAMVDCASEADIDGIPPAWLREASTVKVITGYADDKTLYRPRKSGLKNNLAELAERLGDEAPTPIDESLCQTVLGYLSPGKLADQVAPEHLQRFLEDPVLCRLRDWLEFRKSPNRSVAGRLAAEAIAFVLQQIPLRLRRSGRSSFGALIGEVYERLAGAHGDGLARRIQAQWPVALIDEFQDTDGRQWGIFERIWRGDWLADGEDRRALVLIGDPKQAIYGFRGGDIHAYLGVRQRLPPGAIFALGHNYRSTASLIQALNALYALAGDSAFAGSGIEYIPVAAARTDAAGEANPLRLRLLPAAQLTNKQAGERDRAALDWCARDIAKAIATGCAAGDIAVLLDTNRQIAELRGRLLALGVPVVGAGRGTVLDGEWADDIQLLMAALLEPNDAHAVRGALATRLLGRTAADLDRLARDPVAWERELDWFARQRRLWERRGILAVIEELIVAQAGRLLAEADGERALTDLRHLGELLQEAGSECYGPRELMAWFQRERASSSEDAEAGKERQLRIESEAQRVQLLTSHASKGLEYPVVYLPMAWRYRGERAGPVASALFHDDSGRLRLDLHSPAFKACKRQEAREQLQERMRLLYVALTRAKCRCVAYAFDDTPVTSSLAELERGPLTVLLGGALAALDGKPSDRWDTLMARVPGLLVERDPPELAETATAPEAASSIRLARAPRPARRLYWGTHSFTSLTRRAGPDDAPMRAEDELDEEPIVVAETPAEGPPDARITALESLKGAQFGDAIHQLLEAGRRVGGLDRPWTQQSERIRSTLAGEGVWLDREQEPELIQAVALLLQRTEDSELAPGLRLGALAEHQRRPEFEFSFGLGAVPWQRIRALLAEHDLVHWWPAAAGPGTLRGLFKGYIDLVFAWQGRFHVLDYKTNWLGDRITQYQGAALDRAMARHHYGLQALIYTVALHRYLAHRIDDYDPEQHLGDAWYLFVRGLGLSAGAGIWRRAFPRTLIEGLDALFASTGETP